MHCPLLDDELDELDELDEFDESPAPAAVHSPSLSS